MKDRDKPAYSFIFGLLSGILIAAVLCVSSGCVRKRNLSDVVKLCKESGGAVRRDCTSNRNVTVGFFEDDRSYSIDIPMQDCTFTCVPDRSVPAERP